MWAVTFCKEKWGLTVLVIVMPKRVRSGNRIDATFDAAISKGRDRWPNDALEWFNDSATRNTFSQGHQIAIYHPSSEGGKVLVDCYHNCVKLLVRHVTRPACRMDMSHTMCLGPSSWGSLTYTGRPGLDNPYSTRRRRIVRALHWYKSAISWWVVRPAARRARWSGWMLMGGRPAIVVETVPPSWMGEAEMQKHHLSRHAPYVAHSQ